MAKANLKVHVLSEAEFAVFHQYACFRCGHWGYCSRCKKSECSFGLPLTVIPCERFVRNPNVRF